MTASDPWRHDGEPAPVFDPAALAGWGWELQLPPDQAAMLRSLELAEKAEQHEREERLAERHEAAQNVAIAESIRRAHAAGEAWNPNDPWKHYPSHEQRVAEAFAAMDMQAAVELRAARREAAQLLASHGIHAQVLVDSNAPQSPPPGVTGSSPGDSEPPVSRAQGMAPGVPEVRHRYGLPRGGNESGYVRLRLARFRKRTEGRKR
jgi:hypothetical protein